MKVTDSGMLYQYRLWVAKAEDHLRAVDDRKRVLREAAIAKHGQGAEVVGGDDVDYQAQALIVQDGIVADETKFRERSVAAATMYGIGVIIELLSRIENDKRRST